MSLIACYQPFIIAGQYNTVCWIRWFDSNSRTGGNKTYQVIAKTVFIGVKQTMRCTFIVDILVSGYQLARLLAAGFGRYYFIGIAMNDERRHIDGCGILTEIGIAERFDTFQSSSRR